MIRHRLQYLEPWSLGYLIPIYMLCGMLLGAGGEMLNHRHLTVSSAIPSHIFVVFCFVPFVIVALAAVCPAYRICAYGAGLLVVTYYIGAFVILETDNVFWHPPSLADRLAIASESLVTRGGITWLMYTAIGITGRYLVERIRRFLRHPEGHCQACGYDLTGNVSGNCPECGGKLGKN